MGAAGIRTRQQLCYPAKQPRTPTRSASCPYHPTAGLFASHNAFATTIILACQTDCGQIGLLALYPPVLGGRSGPSGLALSIPLNPNCKQQLPCLQAWWLVVESKITFGRYKELVLGEPMVTGYDQTYGLFRSDPLLDLSSSIPTVSLAACSHRIFSFKAI